MKPLKVIFEPDEDGWWTAIVPDVKGVLSDGRTLVEARRRVRHALALASDAGWTEKAASAVPFIEEVLWPSRAQALLEEHRAAREALDRAADRVEWATWQTVEELVRKEGRSVRDVASVLGISFQRVHQLAHAPEPTVPKESAGGARSSRASARNAMKRLADGATDAQGASDGGGTEAAREAADSHPMNARSVHPDELRRSGGMLPPLVVLQP